MLQRIKPIRNLVNEMLDNLPKSIWSSNSTKFFDPAIGGGQFVAEIERRLRKHGHSDENIRKRVFGFETSQFLIDVAVNMNKLVGQYAKKSYDKFLDMEENKMKFDVVIGNPPYQSTDENGDRKSKSTNLWSRFTQKSFNLVNNDGVVAMITPSSWASNTVDINQGKIKLFKDVFVKNNPLAINLHTVKDHFPTVGSTFSYFVIQKKSNDGNTKLIDEHGKTIYADLRGYQNLPKIISKESMSIDRKFSKYLTNNTTCQGQLQGKSCLYSEVADKKFSWPAYHTPSVEDAGKTWFTNVKHPNFDKPKIIFSLSGYFRPYADDGKIGYTDMCLAYILKEGELLSSANQVFGSKLYSFYLENNKWSGFNPKEIIRSFPVLDLTREWSDQEIYDFFGLTKDEVDYIERT